MNDLKIVYLPIDQIRPYEKNARKHQEEDLATIRASIQAFGFRDPIGIWGKQNTIVEGHGRLMAAQKLGMDKVPCLVADDLTEDQVRAYRLADNKVSDFAIWDNKLLLEELDAIPDDIFTGFELGGIFDDTLDENDNKPVEENEKGVTYEIVVRSEDRKKIERLQELWEQVQNEQNSGS